jgi:hypothetical protein
MKKNRPALLGAVIIGALILFAAAAFAKGDAVAKVKCLRQSAPSTRLNISATPQMQKLVNWMLIESRR